MILSAFGLVDTSPHELSMVLRDLHMSHSLVGGRPRTLFRTVNGLCSQQPVWPIVIDGVKTIHKVQSKRSRLVYFVCDSRAALASTNVSQRMWPDHRSGTLTDAVVSSLMLAAQWGSTNTPWALKRKDLTIAEYVDIATKPSFLNDIQTALYKITPYGLRKEVQEQIIDYLAGHMAYTALNRKLKSSLKLETLQYLLSMDKAKAFRDAVLALRNSTIDEVAKAHGFETFELLYISSSYAKRMAAK